MAGGFRGILELTGLWLATNTGVVSIGPHLRAVPVLIPEARSGPVLVPDTRAARPELVPTIEDGLEL